MLIAAAASCFSHAKSADLCPKEPVMSRSPMISNRADFTATPKRRPILPPSEINCKLFFTTNLQLIYKLVL